MSRSQRLFELLQLLRRRRRPVAGAVLAAELGVSTRTLYRDIATLQGQGARIDGEPGIGYLLQPGFTLPPLMFSENEIEAVALGAQWVAESADEELSGAARDVLAKIAAVVPEHLRSRMYQSPLFIGPGKTSAAEKRTLLALRKAVGEQRKITFRYLDLKGKTSNRIVWPFGLSFFEEARLLMAWCEKRGTFRHFRTDRIGSLKLLSETYPRSKEDLLAQWRIEIAPEEKE